MWWTPGSGKDEVRLSNIVINILTCFVGVESVQINLQLDEILSEGIVDIFILGEKLLKQRKGEKLVHHVPNEKTMIFWLEHEV